MAGRQVEGRRRTEVQGRACVRSRARTWMGSHVMPMRTEKEREARAARLPCTALLLVVSIRQIVRSTTPSTACEKGRHPSRVR